MAQPSGFAPGKLILSGEHAVVCGHPALAVAVDLGTTVRLMDRPGPSGIDHAPFADDRLWPALSTVVPPHGVGVHIHSNLPVGRGMGSSAALAVATVRAVASRAGRVADFAECHRRGFEIERVFHGNPSGVDHAVSALGSGVFYRRGPGGAEIRPIAVPQLRLVVLDSGASGNTAALVAGVARRRPGIDPVLAQIGALTQTILDLLTPHPDMVRLGSALSENHRLLRDIGVSTPRLDALCQAAESAGALGAKLAGAGGGGVVIALVQDPAPVRAAAARLGAPAQVVVLGSSQG